MMIANFPLLFIFMSVEVVDYHMCNEFKDIFCWDCLNFTWPSCEAYQKAINSKRYIPCNNILTGIKAYQDNLYICLPRFFRGTPVTLAVLPLRSRKNNPLLIPYPSWEMNVKRSCSTLKNVYSMEIDTKGVMWVLDGFRASNLTGCWAKIVLLDLNRGGMVLQAYEIPSKLCSNQDGFMNDIVVDESDGGFAYISESSSNDPGIIIYSRSQNRAWKIRDKTMFADVNAAGFVVKGVCVNGLYNVDGIALEPISNNPERLFYYTTLTGYDIYAISTRILKNETLCKGSDWRKEICRIGRKSSPSDGMIIDNIGNLYFGLLPECSIGKWNIYNRFFDNRVECSYHNCRTLDWPDTFGMDTFGNLYVTANGNQRILNNTWCFPPKDGIRFRILQAYIGTRSYLYPSGLLWK